MILKDNKPQTSLKRMLSPLHVWSLALGCIVGGSAFIMPADTFLPRSGPLGTAIAMLIAAAVMSVIAFNYSYMIKKYPVAGGEFTYASKAFGRTHGFICAWFISLSYLSLVPLNATALSVLGRTVLGQLFQFGFSYTVAGYNVYFGEILLAITALVVFAYLAIRGVKLSAVYQVIMVALIVGGVTCFVIAAIANPNTTVENLSPVFAPGRGKLLCIASVFAVAPWAYVGFDTIPQAAEEISFSAGKTKAIMVFSIFFGGLIYILINTVTASYVPEGYASWVEYVSDVKNLSGLMSMPTYNAAKFLMGNPGLIVLGLAAAAACMSGIIGFYMACSRLLYSMAKERVVPAWLGKINEKHSTPKNAILFILAISIFGPIFGRTAVVWIVDMTAIGAAIGYGYTSGAALKLAYKEKNRGIMITGALGVLFSIVFTVLLLVPIPAFNCSLGRESYICFVIWIVLGVFFYLYSVRRKGSGK